MRSSYIYLLFDKLGPDLPIATFTVKGELYCFISSYMQKYKTAKLEHFAIMRYSGCGGLQHKYSYEEMEKDFIKHGYSDTLQRQGISPEES